MTKVIRVLAACVLCAASFASMAQAADTVLLNGHIYTGNDARPWAEALAITAGRIDAVGTTAEVEARKTARTKVIDLHGGTVLPGFIDAHVHTFFGSLVLRGLNLSASEESVWPDETDKLIERLRAYAKAHPKDKVIYGRADFDFGAKSPSREVLDRAVPDRPVMLRHWGGHAMWLNSKAFALAGIGSKPLDDHLEEAGIVRNPDGSPRGVVQEATSHRAMAAYLKTLSREDRLDRVRKALAYLNQFGITSVVNASGDLEEMALYRTLRDRGQLTLRMRSSIDPAPPYKLNPQVLADLETARKLYNDDWLSANLVKFYADGAGMELEGFSIDDFRTTIAELDRRGYQIMTHAIMGGPLHAVLDAYEELEKNNGPRDRRLRVEHDTFLSESDVKRFGPLAVIPSMQPVFCCNKEPAMDPYRSLLDHGAKLAFGSDWPSSVPPNPFIGIDAAVTRHVWTGRHWFGAAQGGRTRTDEVSSPAERLTVKETVDAFTRGSAFAAFMDQKVGTLEVGKLADLVVISQDIFAVPPADIGRTTATLTMVGGKVVFQVSH